VDRRPKQVGDALGLAVTEPSMRLSRVSAFRLIVALFTGAACRSEVASPRTLVDPALPTARSAADSIPTQADADAISSNIVTVHLPYGTMADPGFMTSDVTSPDYYTVSTYNRTGDGANWTGHWVAAEAFRYAVTGSADALSNVQRGVNGLQSLIEVTSPAAPGLLARSWLPQNSPYLPKIQTDEGHNGMYASSYGGQAVYWIGSTSRDQYSGVFFGLAVAYDLVPDATLRAQIASLVTRMLDNLLAHSWNVVMPNGSISTTFVGRSEQQLTLLQIGRHVNTAKYTTKYQTFRSSNSGGTGTAISIDCLDTYKSYYKFNLDYINLFDLIRLEEPTSTYRSRYVSAYSTLRRCTGSHQNAHFNMVDRSINGANTTRDADTQRLLGEWLKRSRRAPYTDVSGKYAVCGTNRACSPVPVPDRPNTDFLWQRSPLLLYGGGDTTVETAGIDYVLPYWMARYYNVLTS
jgi:hypothetical protein